VTEAQPTGKVYRIGFLAGGSPGPTAPNVDQFRQGLRELGYVEGQNIVIEYRWAEGKLDRLPELATDLVRLKVDLIVAPVSTSAQAAHHATRTIPIVMIGVGDPIALGLVGSLPHPGGNVTGNTSYGPELVGKNLEFLKEIVRRQGVRGRRRARILRAQLTPTWFNGRGPRCEPNPQRRQAGRPPSRAADQVRVGDQPQDRQGARSDDPSVDPDPSRRDHPVAVLGQRPQLLRAALGFAECSMSWYDHALHARRSSMCAHVLELETDRLGRSRLLHGQCEQTPQFPPNRQSRSVVGPRQ